MNYTFSRWLRSLPAMTRTQRATRLPQRPVFRLHVESLEDRVVPTVFTVTNTLDDGSVGSLRWAINQVNADTDPVSTIDFNIAPSGVQTIFINSQLPTITHPVVIDGNSEAGWAANTSETLDNANLTVVLDGTNAGASDALNIAGGDSTVEGLQIQNFQDSGIHLMTNGNDTIQGNIIQNSSNYYVVPNPDLFLGGAAGGEVFVDNSAENTIGGTTPAAWNELTNFNWIGIQILGPCANYNQVQGNFIGTDGIQNLATNGVVSVIIENASNNTIGGTVAGSRNIIDATVNGFGESIEIVGDLGAVSPASNNVVQGNFIGTNAAGAVDIDPNATDEIGLDGDVVDTMIGGPTAGEGNVIASASDGGITVNAFTLGIDGFSPTGTMIEGNYIGTDAAGTGILANITGGTGISAGGNTAIVGNVITGCTEDGVQLGELNDQNGTGIEIKNNSIYGNSSNGISVYPSVNGVQIEDNSIYGNTGAGVSILSTDDLVEANSIYGNGGLGIVDGFQDTNLSSNSILANEPGGPFTGTNDPSFSSLTLTETGSALNYSGILNGLSDTTYLVDFQVILDYVPNVSGDYIGSYDSYLTTDGSGEVSFTNLCFPNPDGFPNTPGTIPAFATIIPPHGPEIGNYGQNYPVLSSATSGSTTVVSGTLNGEANTAFTVDLYANPTTDPSGYGQGEYYLGNTSVTTDANGNASFSADLSAAGLPGGVLPSGWSVSATATDPNGNTSEFSQDVTTAPATQTFSQYLQAALPQNASAPGVISIQVGPDQSPATVIAAVNGLTNVTQPVTIIYDLNGGTYSTDGLAVDAPSNVTFEIENGTLDPTYPALTVAGGQVSILNCTLTTSGNAPTLLVTGGNVTLLNDNVIQSSTTYTDPAISLSGGMVNLGTATTPGNNTLNISNSGDVITNTSGNAISAVGDTFTANGTPIAVGPATQVVFTTAPSSNYAGFNLNSGTGVQVAVEDVAGDVVAGKGSTVTLSITSGPSGGAFTSGSVTSVAAQNGVATFTSLAFNLSGTYTLKATDGSLTTATATVVIQPNTGVLLLDPTGNSLNVSGNAVLNVTDNGAIVLNSSNAAAATASGNASITATEIDDTGGVSTSGNAAFHGVINKGVAVMSDPLANLAAPAQPSTQFTSVNYSGTLQPGTYVGGITVSGNNKVTLQPGIYYLTGGGLTVSSNATVTGTGVMIYITGQTGSNPTSINISGNADVTLTPLTSGTYQGIVIFQDRNSNAAITISGNGTLNTTGTEYAPSAKVTLSGNDDTDNPTHTSLGSQWIVDDLTLSGNAKFAITADANNRSDDPNAFMVAGGPVSPSAPLATLTPGEAKAAVREAIALWKAAGLNAGTLQALARTTVTIEPLPAPYLGLAAPGAIYLDTTAEGYGWFTNTSPTATPPAGEIDLLTVVSHELGHLFGLMDGDGAALMASTLAPGVRILPDASDLQALHTSLAVSSVPSSPRSESSQQLAAKIAGEQEPTAFGTLLLDLPPAAIAIDTLAVLPAESSSPTGGQHSEAESKDNGVGLRAPDLTVASVSPSSILPSDGAGSATQLGDRSNGSLTNGVWQPGLPASDGTRSSNSVANYESATGGDNNALLLGNTGSNTFSGTAGIATSVGDTVNAWLEDVSLNDYGLCVEWNGILIADAGNHVLIDGEANDILVNGGGNEIAND